jgi:deoxyribonuclease-4
MSDRLAAEVRELVEALGVGPLFTHTAYLINLGSEDESIWAKSIEALADELVRGRQLGASAVVTHVGTNPTGNAMRAASRIAEGVRTACTTAGEGSDRMLLLENAAGAGRSFGGGVDELAAIFDSLEGDAPGVGVCIDTCHAHAYGYDVGGESGWRELLDLMSQRHVRDRLRLLHANDCLFPRGAHRDRHAWVGDGEIGERGFDAMVRQPELAALPAVTEMPGDVPIKDIENLRRLRALRDACEAP